MYNARVTVRDADGRAEKRWLATDSQFRDVLRSEFGLNMPDEDIDRCVAVMKAKGTGDAPHPFFASVRSGSRLCENPVDAMIPLLNRRGK
jgi:N-hydroxyarylamine O-acetyltransferase